MTGRNLRVKVASIILLMSGAMVACTTVDDVEVGSTVRHHLDAGFRSVITFGVPDIRLPDNLPANVHNVDFDMASKDALLKVVNSVIELAPAQWIYYGYNTEYIFYPFCEHRAIGEMLAFHTEERRDAVLTYVVDLYAGDLGAHPNAVSLEDALHQTVEHLSDYGFERSAIALRDTKRDEIDLS